MTPRWLLAGFAGTCMAATMTLGAQQQPHVTRMADGTFYSRTADGEMGGGTIGILEAPADAPVRRRVLDRTVAAASAPP